MSEPLDALAVETIQLREPCKWCGEQGLGRLEHGDIHIKLVCSNCDTYQKFVSKAELGVEPRSLTPRGDCVKPKRRAQILARDGYRCRLCGATGDQALVVVGHVLSHIEGERLEVEESKIDSDDNLWAMCERCNSGWGSVSLPLWLVVALLDANSVRGGDGDQ